MEREHAIIIKSLENDSAGKLLKDIKHLKTHFSKSATLSQQKRKEGNKLFVEKKHSAIDHLRIWKLYSESVSLSPIDSEELAFAFGNRSAFLLHIKKYKESIEDIERSLKISKSVTLKVKLLYRKIVNLQALGVNASDILEEIKNLIDSIEEKKERESFLRNLEQFQEKLSLKKFLMQEKKNPSTKITSITENNEIDFVALNFNEKYGRHLIAKKNISPGDIILKEKFFVSISNICTKHAYCSNCLKVSWASIPCDYCSAYMFCSDDCKNYAWNTYHKLECSILYLILPETQDDSSKLLRMCLRVLTLSMNEAGSIEKLKNMLDSFETNKDLKSENMLRNNDFLSFYGLFNEKRVIYSEKHIVSCTFLLALLCDLTNFGNLNHNIGKMTDNKDVIFIGSLLLRIMSLCTMRTHAISNSSNSCLYKKDEPCKNSLCCSKGSSLSIVSGLINHSCNPNVRRGFSENNEIIIFAVQPIEKNAQIFDSYMDTFFQKEKGIRQDILKKAFNFTCDCIACTNNWPLMYDLDVPEFNALEFQRYQRLVDYETHFSPKIDLTKEKMEDYRKKISEDIKFSFKKLTQPNMYTFFLSQYICHLINNYYGIQLKIPDRCYYW